MKTIDTNVVPFSVQAYTDAVLKSIETQTPFITITDTIYGIAIPYDLKVFGNILQRAYELKQRENEKFYIRRIPLLVGSLSQLASLKVLDDKSVGVVDDYYRHQCLGDYDASTAKAHSDNHTGVASNIVMKLPTPTTLVLEQSPSTPMSDVYTAQNDASGVNSIGIRMVFPCDEYCPASVQHSDTEPIAQQLRRAIDATTPVFASSANITGDPYIHNIDHILRLFRGKIGTFLYNPDHDPSKSQPSSVISLLKEGEYEKLR